MQIESREKLWRAFFKPLIVIERIVPPFTILTLGLNLYFPALFCLPVIWAILIFTYGNTGIHGRIILGMFTLKLKFETAEELFETLSKFLQLCILSSCIEIHWSVNEIIVVLSIYNYLINTWSFKGFIWEITNPIDTVGHALRFTVILATVHSVLSRFPILMGYCYFGTLYLNGLISSLTTHDFPVCVETVTMMIFLFKFIHFLQFFTFIDLYVL